MISWLVPWICRSSWCGYRIEPYVAPTKSPYPERDDDEFLASLDMVTRNRFINQQEFKSQVGTRSFDPVSDSNVQEYPLGSFRLDGLVSRSYRSVIFRVSETLCLKYSHNCGMRNVVHPALTNAWDGARAGRTGYAPSVYYVSSPRRMIQSDFDFFGFDMTDEQIQQCLLDSLSIRYLVMEWVDGITSADSGLNIRIAEFLKIGERLFEALKSIHQLGIFHGNLKEEHVIIDDSFNVWLIDFGRKPFDDFTFQSPWEMKAESTRSRDDVFRAIRILASVLNRYSVYVDYEKRILDSQGLPALVEWKLGSNFFFLDGITDPIVRVLGVSSRPHMKVVTRLTQFLVSQVSSMHEQPDDIPYGEIISSFKQTEKRFKRRRNHASTVL